MQPQIEFIKHIFFNFGDYSYSSMANAKRLYTNSFKMVLLQSFIANDFYIENVEGKIY